MRRRGDPARPLGRASQGDRHAQGRRRCHRGRHHHVLSRAARALQMPRVRRVRPPAQDLHRQGSEVRAARAGVGRARPTHQLIGPGSIGMSRLALARPRKPWHASPRSPTERSRWRRIFALTQKLSRGECDLPTPWTASRRRVARPDRLVDSRPSVAEQSRHRVVPWPSNSVAGGTARQVDATGAGDAFAAGLIAALLAEDGIQEAMERGAAQGAAAAEALQSVPPDWVESLDPHDALGSAKVVPKCREGSDATTRMARGGERRGSQPAAHGGTGGTRRCLIGTRSTHKQIPEGSVPDWARKRRCPIALRGLTRRRRGGRSVMSGVCAVASRVGGPCVHGATLR
jgi:pfkB family carbohydrate kinase